MREIGSICPYCGCGCRLTFVLEGDEILKIKPDGSDPASQGSPCIKGLTLHEVIKRNRVLHPLLRDGKEGPFRRASWDEALSFIRSRISQLDPKEIFLVPSGKVTNEDNYVLQKFARLVLRTNNIDSCCTRLCHAPTVKALMEVRGLGASEGRMDDIYSRDVLLLVGTNPASNYPVLFHRIVRAKRQLGLKVISVQTIYNETANYADVALTINPGTEVVLFNAIIKELLERKCYDPASEHLEGFDRLRSLVQAYELSYASKLCGCPEESIREALELLAKAERLGAIHGMGMTQHRNAMANLHSLFNLLLLKGGLLLSNRGEVNVQGVGDVGCLPDMLPSGPMMTLNSLAKEWGVEVDLLPSFQGKTILEAFIISPVKAAIITNFNPAQSLPHLDRVHENLKRMFLVVMESHRSLTSEFADVVLPVPSLMERRGSVTTGERRIRAVKRVLDPLGEARPDWWIFSQLARLWGYGEHFPYTKEEEITEEMVRTIPAYREIDVAKLYAGEDQWADKSPKFRRFNPLHFRGTEEASRQYPFILVSFRSAHHFLTNEMTSQSPTLNRFPEGPHIYLNPRAADRLGIREGDRVRVRSSVAQLEGRAKISPKVPDRIVGIHFHFKELLINRLVPLEFDPESFTPNYKAVAVSVEPSK